MKILVDEEYGYKSWVWSLLDEEWHDAQRILKPAFKDGECYSGAGGGLPSQFPIGKWRQVDYSLWIDLLDAEEFDIVACIHTSEDSSYMTLKDYKKKLEFDDARMEVLNDKARFLEGESS